MASITRSLRAPSREQIAHNFATEHDSLIAGETIYQALYAPTRLIARDPRAVL